MQINGQGILTTAAHEVESITTYKLRFNTEITRTCMRLNPPAATIHGTACSIALLSSAGRVQECIAWIPQPKLSLICQMQPTDIIANSPARHSTAISASVTTHLVDAHKLERRRI